MRRRRVVDHGGPYPCAFGCGASLRTKYDRIEIAGWSWFTGFGKKTLHVCPSCAFSRASEVGKLMRERGLEPPDRELSEPFPVLHELPCKAST